MKVETTNARRWWLIDFAQMPWMRGTYRNFGFVAALTLISPLANTIIYWKHRNSRLKFPGNSGSNT